MVYQSTIQLVIALWHLVDTAVTIRGSCEIALQIFLCTFYTLANPRRPNPKTLQCFTVFFSLSVFIITVYGSWWDRIFWIPVWTYGTSRSQLFLVILGAMQHFGGNQQQRVRALLGYPWWSMVILVLLLTNIRDSWYSSFGYEMYMGRCSMSTVNLWWKKHRKRVRIAFRDRDTRLVFGELVLLITPECDVRFWYKFQIMLWHGMVQLLI